MQGQAQVRNVYRSPALPPMGKTLSLAGSPFPHLSDGNVNAYYLGHRKWSKALSSAPGYSLLQLSVGSLHILVPDPNSAT